MALEKRRGGRVSIPKVGENLPTKKMPLRRLFGTFVLWLFGWRFVGDLPNVRKMVAIGAPHTSRSEVYFAIACLWALEIRLTLMAKDALFKWPLGILMRWVGAVPIDRNHPSGVVAQMVEKLKAADQMIVGLAPEGTRKPVEHWKTGFYHIAIGAGVPIFCVGFDFGRKQIVLRELFEPTGDQDEDMATIRGWYAGMTGKIPENFIP